MSGRPCPRGAGGLKPVGLTRAAQLRQAKSAAFVKEAREKDAAAAARTAANPCRKPRVPRVSKGQPPAEPREPPSIAQPGLTKAVLARMKHAQKFQKELDEKKRQAEAMARPRRPRAPVGGDARFGPQPKKAKPCPPADPEDWRPKGALQEAASKSPTIQKLLRMKEERLAQMKARVEAQRQRAEAAMSEAGPSGAAGPCPRKSPPRSGLRKPMARGIPKPQISRKTCELARSMNAEVVQVDPMGEGPIESIVIPPGTVSDCRTTIVYLPQASAKDHAVSLNASDAANRSIQVLNESLDEQDAAESAEVNSKLTELQQARRDFVMSVASVGNNAVNIADALPGIDDETPPLEMMRSPSPPPTPERHLYRVPEVSEERFQVEYGLDHPAVVAAREFAAKSKAAMMEREAQMRMEKQFARAARTSAGLNLDVPIMQEIMEGDISFEEDEETGMILPCASRIKASMPPIPQRTAPAPRDAIDVDEIERFFNVSKYPQRPETPPDTHGPPRGREDLNPDLWDLEDPWYKECPPPEEPDLIDFSGW